MRKNTEREEWKRLSRTRSSCSASHISRRASSQSVMARAPMGQRHGHTAVDRTGPATGRGRNAEVLGVGVDWEVGFSPGRRHTVKTCSVTRRVWRVAGQGNRSNRVRGASAAPMGVIDRSLATWSSCDGCSWCHHATGVVAVVVGELCHGRADQTIAGAAGVTSAAAVVEEEEEEGVPMLWLWAINDFNKDVKYADRVTCGVVGLNVAAAEAAAGRVDFTVFTTCCSCETRASIFRSR